MPNYVFVSALVADIVFLATGCLQLGFALIARSQIDNLNKDGRQLTRAILYDRFPLIATVANAALILTTFAITLPGLISPMRRWLKTAGYLVTLCGVFTLCIGVYLWVMTLRTKNFLFPIYLELDPQQQAKIQSSFFCCGFFNSTAPAFVTDEVCPSPAAASLLRGCAPSVSSYASDIIDPLFTILFGMVGVDAIFVLAIACLLKDRKERKRYRLIDEKNGPCQI